ncbi:hypothetical protein M2T92_01010 [Elizabethkingia miricola]|uniref:hypothetical protein n=1 Tax=Elizabethkingia miricola TaxID=172045 RepID=UPI0009996010|nr:hypothetical protein [Elizabethkingia miricola]MCL1677585.1 hypothetical protein [Elizabethkingia miricola]OPC36323.1 hypothetical protein BAX99_19935 [Elizabethkingia miricola]
MKAFQLKISTLLATIVMLSGVILFGCSDRDNSKAIEELIPNMNLSPEVLDQTVWKGEVIDYYEGKESNRYLITLFFRAGNRVSCYIIKGKDDEQMYDSEFKANGKLLYLNLNYIAGDWLLTNTTKDKIVLKNDPINGKRISVMTLTRIYKANNKLTPEVLNQSIWKGTFVSYKNGTPSYTDDVNLFFRADEVVFFLKGRNDEIESRGTRPYLVDKGMLSISWTWASPQLSGDWLAFEVSKDKLILQKGYGNNNFNYIMTLTRTD